MGQRWKILFFIGLSLGLLASSVWAQPLLEENFEKGMPNGWAPDQEINGVVWQVVDETKHLWGEDAEVRDFPSGTKALYFGRIDNATGKGSYDVGQTVNAEVVTADIQAPHTGWIRISFKYLRVVESYTADDYDITEVIISGQNLDKTIWRKSSKDPSAGEWRSFVSEPIEVNTNFQIVFHFDSVDALNNDYLGWLIDDLLVEEVPEPLDLNVAQNNHGTVGKTYDTNNILVQLTAEGGTPPYSWAVVEGYSLPSRLSLQAGGLNNADCFIVGTPEVPGNFFVKIRVQDAGGQHKGLGLHIIIEPDEDDTVIRESFDGLVGSLPAGWSKEPADSLWHLTEEVTVQGQNILDFNNADPDEDPPADVPSAYYGKDDADQPNYDTGHRTWGYLISPRWDVSAYRGHSVRIVFHYWREVEETVDGGYDKTFVEIRFDNGDWVRIWEKDSLDVSKSKWQMAGPIDSGLDGAKIIVPRDARTLQIRFGFDSVDSFANDKHVGWLVDDLEIRFVPTQVEIVTDRLPPAEVGSFYSYTFEAQGGQPPYRWEVVGGRPPCGLLLDRHTGELRGTISCDPGSYDFTIKVTEKDGNGTEKTKDFTLQVVRKSTLFSDDFEDGLVGWDVDGLWHRTNGIKGVDLTSHGFAAYYGKDDATAPNYNTGARTTGALTSPEFHTEGATAFKVTFDYWRDVEYYAPGGYDRTCVQARFKVNNHWSPWYTIWTKDSSSPSQKTWLEGVSASYIIPSGATKMQIRFVFDSVDRYYNIYAGWVVDNVKVCIASSGGPLPSSLLTAAVRPRGEVEFFNEPNPVTDVHTTVFGVRGVEVESIRVEVYDLSGRLVWKGEAVGNELVWHTEDLVGRYLANGVYLYVVYVKVGDTWIQSDIRKLAIFR